MANQRLTDKSALEQQTGSGDLFMVVDVSDTTGSSAGTSKKIDSKFIIQTDKFSLTNAEVIQLSHGASPNTLVGRKDDDILMAPGIAKAGGTTQGGHGTTDVGAQFARGVKELKDEVKKMREDNKSYFGFGGTVAPGVGKSVVGGINDSVRYG